MKATYLLFLSCLLLACEHKQILSEQKMGKAYCENTLELITAADSLLLIPIEASTSYETVLAQLETLKPMTSLDDCSQLIYFATPFALEEGEEIKLKVRIYRQCPELVIRCGVSSAVDILLNSRGARLVEDEPDDSKEFITQQLRQRYFNYGADPTLPDHPRETFVRLKWLPDVPKDSLQGAIQTVITSYYGLADEYSHKVYHKKLCELSATEILKLKKEFPLNIELGFNKQEYIIPEVIIDFDKGMLEKELTEEEL